MAVNKKSLLKHIIIGLLVAIGAFAILNIMAALGNSWIKIPIIALAVAALLLVLVTKGKIRKVSGFFGVGILIFAIIFASVGTYLFAYAGYPPTYTVSEPKVTLSFQGLLNGSVAQVVQNVTQSPAFSLLKLEHGSNVTLRCLEFRTASGNDGGYIRVVFNFDNSNDLFNFISSNGKQYVVSRSPNEATMPPFSREITQETLESIDSLGINWFYTRCLENVQNRTNELPSIDSLTLTIEYEEYDTYQGITVILNGYHQSSESSNKRILWADFQPEGTLINSAIWS